ncbi:zinc dependent phospholipase C family protein [Bradyrhizobium sp. AUGA SZCCT0431]|uniref:zinc dependent phospholipase C family protein n=1 Tax=Bradyrhizobium sp. AUGA SZCCT0431 TaxID=2807674 RepID=UPI001BAADE71|nr:zinc dependent phospholipase C family protein [Bradyrhizobium sp. AUGA SZCCT0431]MBR1144720.1 zinc dependent phospholipase C family protein [Bradyrhizobium sp. AUGA SZCCT0431]
MRISAFIVALAAAFSSSQAFAFKVNTHVWVGQEVINDLNQCMQQNGFPCFYLKFLDRTKDQQQILKVSDDAYSAIKSHPNYFLMGNLGPDAYPGIYEGQMVIHPGITREKGDALERVGYGTGEFFNHMLREARGIADPVERQKALAFTYGCLAHASADVFAHSYVNTLSGDVFVLVDGEVAVENRHMALENFIEKYTPPMKGGVRPAQLIKEGDQLAVPADFLTRSLVFNPNIQEQYEKTPLMAHFNLVYKLHQELKKTLCEKKSEISDEKLAENLFNHFRERESKSSDTPHNDFENIIKGPKFRPAFIDSYKKYKSRIKLAEGCAVQKIDVLVLQIVFWYYTDYFLNVDEAQKLLEYHQKIHRLLSGTSKEISKRQNQLEDMSKELVHLGIRTQVAQYNQMADGLKETIEVAKKINAAENEVAKLEKDLAKLGADLKDTVCKEADKICKAADYTTKGACRMVSRWITAVTGGFWRTDRVCDADFLDQGKLDACKKGVEDACKGVPAAQALINASINATNLKVAAEKELLKQLEGNLEKSKETMRKFGAALEKAYSDMLAIKHIEEEAVLDLALRLAGGLRTVVEGWIGDIEKAMREYVKANGEAILVTMTPENRTHFWEPLMKWFDCYKPAFLGVPQQAGPCAVIEVKKRFEDLKTSIDEAAMHMAPPVVKKTREEFDKFVAELPFKIAEQTHDEFSKIIKRKDVNLELILHAVKMDISREKLDEIFSQDKTSKSLLVFPPNSRNSISSRVLYDMGVKRGQTHFTVQNFGVAYNAILLAKLSLLNAEGLNAIARAVGVQDYYHHDRNDNIITSSIFSIDGNHQWMSLSPPFLKASPQSIDTKWEQSAAKSASLSYWRRFSMQESDREHYGFKFFTRTEARHKIFNKIFKAPLLPSFQETKKFDKVVPDGYPLRITPEEPFGIMNFN